MEKIINFIFSNSALIFLSVAVICTTIFFLVRLLLKQKGTLKIGPLEYENKSTNKWTKRDSQIYLYYVERIADLKEEISNEKYKRLFKLQSDIFVSLFSKIKMVCLENFEQDLIEYVNYQKKSILNKYETKIIKAKQERNFEEIINLEVERNKKIEKLDLGDNIKNSRAYLYYSCCLKEVLEDNYKQITDYVMANGFSETDEKIWEKIKIEQKNRYINETMNKIETLYIKDICIIPISEHKEKGMKHSKEEIIVFFDNCLDLLRKNALISKERILKYKKKIDYLKETGF